MGEEKDKHMVSIGFRLSLFPLECAFVRAPALTEACRVESVEHTREQVLGGVLIDRVLRRILSPRRIKRETLVGDATVTKEVVLRHDRLQHGHQRLVHDGDNLARLLGSLA